MANYYNHQIDSHLFVSLKNKQKKELKEYIDENYKEKNLTYDGYKTYIDGTNVFLEDDATTILSKIKITAKPIENTKDLTSDDRLNIRKKMIELFIKGLIEANKNEKSSKDDKNDKLSELLDNYIKIKIKEQTTVLDYIRDWLPIIFTLIFIILIIIKMFYIRRYKNEFNIKFKIKSKKKQKGGNSRSKKRKKYVDVIFYN